MCVAGWTGLALGWFCHSVALDTRPWTLCPVDSWHRAAGSAQAAGRGQAHYRGTPVEQR